MTFEEPRHIAKLARQAWQTRRLASCVLKISLRAIIALSRVKSRIRSKSTSLTASTHLTWKITELSCIAHCALSISHRIRILSSDTYFTFGCILICVCLASRTLGMVQLGLGSCSRKDSSARPDGSQLRGCTSYPRSSCVHHYSFVLLQRSTY